jgi:hypothetical protein
VRRATQKWGRRRPVVHALRVISWAERRAGSVCKLHLDWDYSRALHDFSSEDLGTLVAVMGPSLTELDIGWGCGELDRKPFWKSLRDSVVPAGLLRSLVVRGFVRFFSESDAESLGQLAGSLEELVLTDWDEPPAGLGLAPQLPRFPESICDLTELRRLELAGQSRITAIPAQISSLKKLKELILCRCRLTSLPRSWASSRG